MTYAVPSIPMNRDNLQSIQPEWFLGFPTRVVQWAREHRPYDYKQFYKCQHTLIRQTLNYLADCGTKEYFYEIILGITHRVVR